MVSSTCTTFSTKVVESEQMTDITINKLHTLYSVIAIMEFWNSGFLLIPINRNSRILDMKHMVKVIRQKGRIAAAHGRFNHVRQVAPMCTPMGRDNFEGKGRPIVKYRDSAYRELCNKCSAIAEMGDRLATIDYGRKVGGCCASFWWDRRSEAETTAGHKHWRGPA